MSALVVLDIYSVIEDKGVDEIADLPREAKEGGLAVLCRASIVG
jgi:hypothetical protein